MRFLKEIQENYELFASAGSDRHRKDGFDEYQNQELEVAAREYAEKETKMVLSYLDN